MNKENPRVSLEKEPGRRGTRRYGPLDQDPAAQNGSLHILITSVRAGSGGQDSLARGGGGAGRRRRRSRSGASLENTDIGVSGSNST